MVAYAMPLTLGDLISWPFWFSRDNRPLLVRDALDPICTDRSLLANQAMTMFAAILVNHMARRNWLRGTNPKAKSLAGDSAHKARLMPWVDRVDPRVMLGPARAAAENR